jgi:hypothetical protein
LAVAAPKQVCVSGSELLITMVKLPSVIAALCDAHQLRPRVDRRRALSKTMNAIAETLLTGPIQAVDGCNLLIDESNELVRVLCM